MTTNTNAERVYKNRQREIRALLEELEKKLESYLQPGEAPHWGHVADLGHIRETLYDLLDPQ